MPKQPTETITMQEYRDADNDLAGWCTACLDWVNHGSCEPDASGYTCEQCEQPTVYGAEEALLLGYLTIG